ncbi:MAG: restriction endonuclease, SacI family [Solirubrobacteraceae bacterium]
MAIRISSEDSIRILEEATRLARDPGHSPSELWLDRVASLEEWRGNKLALTVFATAALAKATESEVDALSLIDRSGDPRSYNARMFARDVLVPNARRLRFLLGTSGPDPLAGSPWFGPERIDEIAKWRSRSRERADDLIGWLSALTAEDAKAALIALIRRRSQALERQLEDRRNALVLAGAGVDLKDLTSAVDRFIARNPEEGRRGAAAAAAAFIAAGRRVIARPVNDPGQVDVDVLDSEGFLLIGLEVKQRPATEQDARDIAEGARIQGATRAILCAFDQGGHRLPIDRLVAEADTSQGVLLHIVCTTSELIRLAALTSETPRPTLLREFQRAFSEQLAELDASQAGLDQWKTITEHWARKAPGQASLIDGH